MTNLLTVKDPDEGASEEATQTRELLQVWADKHLPSGEDDGIKALDEEVIKARRAEGADCLSRSQGYLNQLSGFTPPTMFGKLLGEFSYATRLLSDRISLAAHPREYSHALEGLAKEFSKQFFQGGMKWNLHAEYLALCSLNVPHRTTGQQDSIYSLHCVNATLGGAACSAILGQRSDSEWGTAWVDTASKTKERFNSIRDWLVAQCGAEVGEEGVEYWYRKSAAFSTVGVQIHYMDHDGPWVAGFLTLDDACKMRFRRIRLGAHLAEQGIGDLEVRKRVEQAKQEIAGAKFEAYPNDTQWEEVYTNGPSSCMSDSSNEYECWDGLHPVDAYSSSYHGAGDNSLVLLVSRDESGNITGRGILNLQKGTIVRWYGDPVAERVLLRQDVDVSDRSNMDGTWLALLQRGNRFIHPYVDGCNAYGDIQGSRVYICDDGGCPCIQETSGSSYMGEVHYCIDKEENIAADECTYQPISDTYISDYCDSWRCPIIGEYCNNTHIVMLHGIEVDVSDHVYYNTNQYLTQVGSGVWMKSYTIDDDDIRESFLEEHGIEDDAEDDDEEAA